MRAFVFFVLGMLLGACARPQTVIITESASHVAAAAELQSKTVALVAPTEDGVRAFCTGVWISNTTILTADHCVDDSRLGESVSYATRGDLLDASGATLPKPSAHSSALYARDEDHDLALLRAFAPPLHTIATLNDEPIEAGQHVQVMGHPLGLLWSYSEGTIAAIRRLDLDAYADGSTWIQAAVPISPGNSGGGLYDADGHLIGITTATFTRGQNLNVFVHRVHIAAFLKAQTERTSL